MATPKHFGSTEMQNFGLHFSDTRMSHEMQRIRVAKTPTDMLDVTTHPGIAEMHAELFHISAPEMLIELWSETLQTVINFQRPEIDGIPVWIVSPNSVDTRLNWSQIEIELKFPGITAE
jgi:hypothetical protein